VETGETLLIAHAGGTDNFHWLNAVEFGDGTVWERNEIFNNGLYGTGGNDSITLASAGKFDGEAGNDTIYGTTGMDTLLGGTGNDIMNGGAGNDSYIFRCGDGQDSITNNNSGGHDLLSFADIDPTELWFGKSGYHLVIGVVGSSDQVTVNNWYSGSLGSYSIDRIEAEGSYLVESQVAQLVQAMAAVGAPGGAGGQWTDEQRETLAPIMASYWQPRA
jgi:Ca2+-binding RTX toxin-like protein